MILPTIHLNGTSPQSLLEQYDEARTAVRAAMDKLRQIDLNARDYYTQGPDAYREAVNHHTGMTVKLTSVANDLLRVVEHCQNAIDEKSARRRQAVKESFNPFRQ